jgi:hypothetical protein
MTRHAAARREGAGFVGLGTTAPLTPLEISSVSPVITLCDVQPGIGLNAPLSSTIPAATWSSSQPA